MSMSAGSAKNEDAKVEAPTSTPKAAPSLTFLSALSGVVLNMVLTHLDSDMLVRCLGVCHELKKAAVNDDLWKAKCLQDWGQSRRVLPPDRTQMASTYLDAWRTWRRTFDGYEPSAVRRVAVWWDGIEEWMTKYLPEIMPSLNAGACEEDLDAAEDILGWKLPAHVRLLYRFHDGQWLPWDERFDESLGITDNRPSPRPEFKGIGRSLGLLGGYRFYERMVSSKLFSIKTGARAGRAAADAFDSQHRGFFEASARNWDTNLDAIRRRGGFLLAGSNELSKRAWVGKDGNVRFDGKSTTLWGVLDAAPVSEASGQEGNLIPWLEEYLRRLRTGYYSARDRWLEISDTREEMPEDEAEPRSLRTRGVWLFPDENSTDCVSQVTQGVKIQASPAFVPEACSQRTDVLWAYSVRMRLLRDHPSRPQAMTSCQLSSRHWDIDGQEGFHREVAGHGVIGAYPLLKLRPDSTSTAGTLEASSEPYDYESCTSLAKPPGTMGGYFTFTPGTAESPSGPDFNAIVPPFSLSHPSFIF